MLQITHDAAELVGELRRTQEVPEDHGLRIFPESTAPGEVTLGLGFTPAPAAGDDVTEQEGLKLFIAPELTTPLADTTLDVTKQGDDERLVFRPQTDEERSPG